MNYLSLSKQGRTHVNIKSNFMQCIYQYAPIQLDNWYITESKNVYGYIYTTSKFWWVLGTYKFADSMSQFIQLSLFNLCMHLFDVQ